MPWWFSERNAIDTQQNQAQFGMFSPEPLEDGYIYWAICVLPSRQTDNHKLFKT